MILGASLFPTTELELQLRLGSAFRFHGISIERNASWVHANSREHSCVKRSMSCSSVALCSDPLSQEPESVGHTDPVYARAAETGVRETIPGYEQQALQVSQCASSQRLAHGHVKMTRRGA
jgi:hypothetical protein